MDATRNSTNTENDARYDVDYNVSEGQDIRNRNNAHPLKSTKKKTKRKKHEKPIIKPNSIPPVNKMCQFEYTHTDTSWIYSYATNWQKETNAHTELIFGNIVTFNNSHNFVTLINTRNIVTLLNLIILYHVYIHSDKS